MMTLHVNSDLFGTADSLGIKDILIPIGPDISSEKIYIELNRRYSDFSDVLQDIVPPSDKMLPGFVYIIPLKCETRLILAVVKDDSKYAATISNINKCVKSLHTLKDKFMIRRMLMPAFDSNIVKLVDFICLPYTADKFATLDIDIAIVDMSNKYQYVMVEELHSWKANGGATCPWLKEEDLLLTLAIIQALHDEGLRLSKSKMIEIYKRCKSDFNMFEDIEFTKTDYGEFFKEFSQKWFFLINHGILKISGAYKVELGPTSEYFARGIVALGHEHRSKVYRLSQLVTEVTPKESTKKGSFGAPKIPKSDNNIF